MVFAQKIGEIQINESFQNQPLKDLLEVLRQKYGVKVFYKENWVEPYTIDETCVNTPLIQVLNNVFSDHELTFAFFQDDGIVIFRKALDTRSRFDDEAQIMIIGNPLNIGRYKSANLKGRVIDGKTGNCWLELWCISINLIRGHLQT